MPIFEEGNILSFIGIRKIWKSDFHSEFAFDLYLENREGDFSIN